MNKLNQNQLDDLTAEMNNYMAEPGKKLFPPAKADELREMGVKRCGRCKEVKLVEDFPKLSSRRDGLHYQCRSCNSAGGADYYQRNTDKALEYAREYREQNRDQIREYFREYNHIRYRNGELYRLQAQLNSGYYRAVTAGNEASWITAEQLLTYWAAKDIDPLVCYLTGDSLDTQTRSIDHVVAIGNGGEHVVENLLPATLEANLRKRNMSAADALARLNQ